MSVPLRGDHFAALALSRKLASSTPVLNFPGAEISLLLENMGVEELIPSHIYGAANKTEDALSRLAAPQCALLPAEVLMAKRRECAVRDLSFYKRPPPNNIAEDLTYSLINGNSQKVQFACPWSSRQALGGA